MAKSDSRFRYQAKLGRTDFDLSRRFGFSTPPGSLLPIWFDLASPGDSYYMQHNLPLLRSCNLAAPAMVDVKVHFETFFVPMQMLYQPFEQTVFSIKGLQSSNFGSELMNNAFPLFDYSSCIDSILSHATSSIRQQAFRLADLFGLNAMNFVSKKYAPSFFPYQICAYHAIYQYYYRLDDKSEFYNGYFNLDRFYNTATFKMDDDFMGLHNRPWEFDYFSSIYRSPIVSAVNAQYARGLQRNELLNVNVGVGLNLNGSNGAVQDNDDIASYGQSYPSNYNALTLAANSSSVAIRQMFANEKLAMITGRTKKNYDSQVLAHYGVNVPHDVKHDITMIHHDSYDLNVQEVTSLANTADGALGELAGKSYAAGHGDKFKFIAPCHGVIMTIFSVEPRRNYLSAFDRINAITNAYDLPVPEYDRLGNVPMYLYESYVMPSTGATPNYTNIVGWKERYYQFKRKYNRCTVGFGSAYAIGSGAIESVNNYSAYFIADVPFTNNPNTSVGASVPVPSLESSFYINNNSVDNLCYVNYVSNWIQSDSENWTNTPWLVYARDPFIVDSRISCTKVSWMSKDGEPIYD